MTQLTYNTGVLLSFIIPGAIIIFLMIFMKDKNDKYDNYYKQEVEPFIYYEQQEEEQKQQEPKEKPPYAPKKILTKAEQVFYKELVKHLRQDAVAMPKVGLKEFLYVPYGTPNYKSHWAKISQKHVDFLICDKYSLYIYCAVELDDKSHEQEDRIARDQFVDEAIRTTGMAIIHLPCKYSYEASDFQPINDIVSFKKENMASKLAL